MISIKLKRLEVANFKGLHSLSADFGHRTKITGANGTCKSTIPDAYNWCLFGTNAQGSTQFCVRPLNENNELVPDLAVKVALTFDIDSRDVTFTRILAAGKNNNIATYCVNDVPCKMAEFDEKVNAICRKDDFKLITSITAFNALDTKSARAKLQQIAGSVSDIDIAAKYPEVLKAINDGKTVEELKREIVAKKTKSTNRLEQIPTAINAQEELRPVGVDFAAMQLEAAAIEKKIIAIDATLQKNADATQPQFEAYKLERKKLNDLAMELQECEASIEREYQKRKNDIEAMKSNATSSIVSKQREEKALDNELSAIHAELSGYKERLLLLSNQWQGVNEKEFNASVIPVCPVCHKAYTKVELNDMRIGQIEQFNQHKLKELDDIERKAEEIQNAKSALIFNMEEGKKVLAELRQQISELEREAAKLDDTLVKFPLVAQVKAANQEFIKLSKDIELQSSILASMTPDATDCNNDGLEVHKVELKKHLAGINRELGRETLNDEINKRKMELLDEEKALAQAIACCDKTEAQIKAFTKRRIEMVEESVASLFKIVRFKMYEQNLTNDGEKEICECIVDGIPYSSLNTAMRINAGIDIINGLSKALGVLAPIFVDGKESVSDLIETNAQLITLEVVEGAKLSII